LKVPPTAAAEVTCAAGFGSSPGRRRSSEDFLSLSCILLLESTGPATPLLSAAILERWMWALVPLPHPRPTRQRRLHSFSRPQSHEEKNGCVTKHDTRSGSFTKNH
jgi:hypothetical protein